MPYVCKARLLAGFIFLLLAGCSALGPQTRELGKNLPADFPQRTELERVPFFPQDDYYCGPSALAMALNAAGANVTPEALVDQVYLPGRKGSLQVEMLAAARRNGYIAYELAPQLKDLLTEIAAGTPAIVLENYGFSWYPVWHYSVAVGYDLAKHDLIRRSGFKQRLTMPLPVFERLWRQEGMWAMVVVPPDRVPATADETRYAAAVVALEKNGHLKGAFSAYNAMLKRWPASLTGQMGRGNVAYALRDLTTAETAFRQASIDHADSAAAFNNLANVLAEHGKLSEALAAAEKAVNLGGPMLTDTQATLDEIRQKVAVARAEEAARAAKNPPPAAAPEQAAPATATKQSPDVAPKPKAKKKKTRVPAA